MHLMNLVQYLYWWLLFATAALLLWTIWEWGHGRLAESYRRCNGQLGFACLVAFVYASPLAVPVVLRWPGIKDRLRPIIFRREETPLLNLKRCER